MEPYNSSRQIAGMDYQIRELTTSDIRQWLKDIEAAHEQQNPKRPKWFKRVWRCCLEFVGLASRSLPARKRDAVDVMLFDGFVMLDLRYLTNLTEQQIARLTPRQIREVWAACEEVNRDFFQMRRRMEAVGIASPAMHAAL